MHLPSIYASQHTIRLAMSYSANSIRLNGSFSSCRYLIGFCSFFCSFTSDLRFVYQMHQSAASSLNVLVKPLPQKIMGAQFICAVNSK